MSRRTLAFGLLVPLLFSSFSLAACSLLTHGASSDTKAKPAAVDLDSLFTSPTGRFTIRVNRSWQTQEFPTNAGMLDYFALPNAAFSIVSDNVITGTQLDHYMQATLDQYRQVHVQGLSREGTVDIGGGHGDLLKARTYVNGAGQTVYTAPSPGATPRILYQAFYVAGDVGYTFSMAWPQDDHTDYLSLFRTILRTFTLAGTT